MHLMTLEEHPITDVKQAMLYIFNCYKNSIPLQTNLFKALYRNYRSDMLDNANDIEAQKEAMINSLTLIYQRYGFGKDLEVSVTFEEDYNRFTVDISGYLNGTTYKLSETLIFEQQ